MFCLKQTEQMMLSFAGLFSFPKRSHYCHVHVFLSSLLNKRCFYRGLMNGMHLLQLFKRQFKHTAAANYETRFIQLGKRICYMLLVLCLGCFNKSCSCLGSSVFIRCDFSSHPVLPFPNQCKT